MHSHFHLHVCHVSLFIYAMDFMYDTTGGKYHSLHMFAVLYEYVYNLMICRFLHTHLYLHYIVPLHISLHIFPVLMYRPFTIVGV